MIGMGCFVRFVPVGRLKKLVQETERSFPSGLIALQEQGTRQTVLRLKGEIRLRKRVSRTPSFFPKSQDLSPPPGGPPEVIRSAGGVSLSWSARSGRSRSRPLALLEMRLKNPTVSFTSTCSKKRGVQDLR